MIFAKTLYQAGKQVENKNYLNSELFINQFYDPANAILGENIICFAFEQEYHRKADRISPSSMLKTWKISLIICQKIKDIILRQGQIFIIQTSILTCFTGVVLVMSCHTGPGCLRYGNSLQRPKGLLQLRTSIYNTIIDAFKNEL